MTKNQLRQIILISLNIIVNLLRLKQMIKDMLKNLSKSIKTNYCHFLNLFNAESTLVQKTREQRRLYNYLTAVMLVFIGYLAISTLRWVTPMFH